VTEVVDVAAGVFEQSVIPAGASVVDEPWDEPGASSEAATVSHGAIIAHEQWNGFTRGERVRVVSGIYRSLAGGAKTAEFLCHRHKRGEEHGWVDVYSARKNCLVSVPESGVYKL